MPGIKMCILLQDTGGEFKNNARFELEVVIFQGWKIEFATSILQTGEPIHEKRLRLVGSER
jgi:hypothetical protein